MNPWTGSENILKRRFITELAKDVFSWFRTIESTQILRTTRYQIVPQSAKEKIHVKLGVPEPYRAKAWYGLRMLFLPFRVDLVEGLGQEGDFSLYYGVDSEEHDNVTLSLHVQPESVAFFTANAPHPTVRRYLKVESERIPVLFEGRGDFSFDPVATSVYFLSGWQEVFTRECDEHGRFAFASSIQSQLNSPLQPTVDWIRHVVATRMRSAGAKLEQKRWGDAEWSFCPTHDIDYDRKWRLGIYKRELLNRSILNEKGESFAHRLERSAHALASLVSSRDPFRSAMIRMREEVEQRGGQGTYFFKTGGQGLRDVEYDLNNDFLLEQRLYLERAGFEIGLHPSYYAFQNLEELGEQKTVLDRTIGHQTTSHRAHYLRYRHPESAHHLSTAGFTIDSSLGFASQCGFRNATCLPFPLFDPVTDTELDIWEMPLSVMESALFNRMNLGSVEAIEATRAIMKTCADFGGLFVGLWHNTLWDEADYPGWGAHFETALNDAVKQKASIMSLSKALKAWQ